MSAADSQAATDRVRALFDELGPDHFGILAFLAVSCLAHNAPEACHFILDRTLASLQGGEGS